MPPGGGIKIVCEANLSSLQSSEHHMINNPVSSYIDTSYLDHSDSLFTMASKRSYEAPVLTQWTGGESAQVSGEVQETRRGRGSGGRRLKTEEDLNLDPEEEEKRRMRRERNKLAAARCRKRRVDQIESLQQSVEEWEEKKRMLQQEIASLEQQRTEYQFILEAHKTVCRRQEQGGGDHGTGMTGGEHGPRVVTVKTEPELLDCYNHDTSLDNYHQISSANQRPEFSTVSTNQKPPRPATLSLKTMPLRSIEGVSIDTPSTCLNFDALLDTGRTGLTPTNILAPININLSGHASSSTPALNTPGLGPSCGTQQRGLSITATLTELSSPSSNAPNLVSL